MSLSYIYRFIYYFIPLPQWGFLCFLHTQTLLCVINFGSVCLILNDLKCRLLISHPPLPNLCAASKLFLSYCGPSQFWLIQKPTSTFNTESPFQWSILSNINPGLSGNNCSYFWVSLNPIQSLYFKPLMTSI